MAGGTGLKKIIGRIIVCVYVQLLELQKAYDKTSPFKRKVLEIEDSVLEEQKTALEEAVTDLEGRIDYVRTESLEKWIKLMKTTVTTASTILTTKNEAKDVT